jgi:hypothetical protein
MYSVYKYKIPDLITNINFSCIDKNRLMIPLYLAFVCKYSAVRSFRHRQDEE